MPISPSSAAALYEAAFPPEERRPTPRWLELVAGDDGRFEITEVRTADGRFAGFITTWDLTTCRYVEHFAILASERGGGIGGAAFDDLMERVGNDGKPLVLEVEEPADDLSRRRIGFYERHGMHLLRETPYVQPPYHAGGQPLPMKLMTSWEPERLGREETARIIREIHREIYAWSPAERG